MSELNLMQRILKITGELSVEKNGKQAIGSGGYFKLEDVLASLKPLLIKYDVFMHYDNVKIEAENTKGMFRGTLTLIDATNPESKVTYVADMNDAELMKATEIQKSGANITYGKRYLVMNAFNLSDDVDEPDAYKPVPTTPKKPVVEKATGAEAVQSILDIFKPFKVVREDFERKYAKPMEELTEKEFSEIRKMVSQLKKQEKTKEELFA